MVYIRLQRKQMDEMVEEPHVITGESSRDAEAAFIDRVLDQMGELASDVASIKAENVEF